MPEGNASVEVACVKAEIDIDLEKFEEALEQAQELFEQFADSISEGLYLKINVEDDGLIDAENRINSLKDSLSNIETGNIEENIDTTGVEETKENLETIKELKNEISDKTIDIDVKSEGTEETIANLDEVQDIIRNLQIKVANFEESDLLDKDLDINTQSMIDSLQRAVDKLHELKIAIGDTSNLNIDDAIELIGINESIDEVKELRDKLESISKEFDIDINTSGIDGALMAFDTFRTTADEDMDTVRESEDETKESGEDLTETLGTAIYALQAVYGAMSTIAKGALEGFAQMQISGNIANRVFGKFGENIKSFADNSVNSLGLASGETLHYADTLGLALKSQGATTQQSAIMAMNLIKVADNLSLASGGSVTMQQAVQTLTSAIAGQTYGLKSLGINVTGVNKRWTPLHQAMYVMGKVSQDVTKNFGTLGQNMNTTAGEISRTKTIIGEFGESLGEALSPQLAILNKKLSSLYKWWNNLSESTKHSIVVFGEVVVGVLGVASALYVAIKAVDAMKVVFETLSGLMDDNPIGLALMAIAGACFLLYEAWKHNFGGMRTTLNHLMSDLEPFGKLMVSLAESIAPELKTIWDNLVIIGKSLMPVVKLFLHLASPFIIGAIGGIALGLKGIVLILEGMTHIIVDVIKGFYLLATAIRHPFETAKDIITGNFKAIYDSAKANFDGIVDATTKSSTKMKNTYVDSLKQMLNENKAKMRTMEEIAQDGGKAVNKVQLENLQKSNKNLEEKIKQAESTVKKGTGNMAKITSINFNKMVKDTNTSGKEMSKGYISHLKTMLRQTNEQIHKVHEQLAKGNEQISEESARSLERTQRRLERHIERTQKDIAYDSKRIARDVKDGTSKAKIAAIQNSIQMKEKYIAQLETMLNQTKSKLSSIKSSVSTNTDEAKKTTLSNLEQTRRSLEIQLRQAERSVRTKTCEMKNSATENASQTKNNISQELGSMQSIMGSNLSSMLSNTQNWGQNTKNTVSNTFDNANSTMNIKMLDMVNTTDTKMVAILNSITKKLTSMLNAINKWGNNSNHSFSTIYQNINIVVGKGMGKMVSTSKGHLDHLSNMFNSMNLNSAGQNMVNSLLGGLQSSWGNVTSWASSAGSSLGSMLTPSIGGANLVNGSHETGLSYVPWDGYRAELHKGEMVLTREQAESYRSGNNGGLAGDTNITVNTTSSDPYEIASSVRRTLNQLANGF